MNTSIIRSLLLILLCINVISFFVSLLFPEKNPKREKQLAKFSFASVLLSGIITLLLLVFHIIHRFASCNIFLFTILEKEHYEFTINLLWNTTTLIFLFTGNIITLLILYFSRYYMYNEDGFKRFFNTLMFFYLAYNLVVLAGDFTTLFFGWEYLGLSSFLLIAFYRHRYLPSRNAVKIFSVYRFGDIGMLAAIWGLHHLIQKNILFYDIQNDSSLIQMMENHYYESIAIGIGLLIASIGKSALFPLSYWLPRAMEGPTASSAIFYGALSVHMGLLLLIRTFQIWEHFMVTKILVCIIGLITFFTGNLSAKIQSSIKAQIAYSSVAQIGVMYVELAFGWLWLVHLHFISNAFLRTYQLLVSPSMAAYIMRQQMYFSRLWNVPKHFLEYLPSAWKYTLFSLAHNEWYLDYSVSTYVFGVIKSVGRWFRFINNKTIHFILLPLFVISFVIHEYKINTPFLSEHLYSIILSFIAVILIIRAFSERSDPLLVLYLILFSELFIAISISYNERYDIEWLLFYLSGIFPGFITAWLCLTYLRTSEPLCFSLNKYYGHIYEYRRTGFIFLISILAMMGFPVTPTFLGEDIIIEHIHSHQFLLAFNFSTHFVLTGITGIKLYARLFLGPHCKTYHETALKSS
jgi:NADH:ubiquinone oxidoreductase subunit 5 (subunit L)/multisubunit Na+/H+ antiporter MnhA subunit